MAYLALYRKYRPNTFDGLIGQEHIVKTLVNQIENDRLGHAYLFTGTRGTGKTSAAKIFAKAINCLNPKNGSPCGECECCRAISNPSNIDVIEIDAASNNGVNEIRDLREKVQYPPVSCKYKVYIIDEVHMLTGAAFNALLKTLEEPPKHAVFILATTEVHKIPATILSRCMRFDFRLISNEKIAELISGIYDEQGKEYDKEAVFAIAKAGEGSIRDALSIADTAISFGTGKLTYDDVMEILGSSNSELMNEFIIKTIEGDSGAVLSIIDELCSLGKSVGVLIKDLTLIIRDLLIVKTCQKPNDILALPQEKFSIFNSIATSCSEQRLLRMLEIFSDAENYLKYTNHSRVVFETASVKACRPDSDYDMNALLARINELEIKLEQGVKVQLAKGNATETTESVTEQVADNQNIEEEIVPKNNQENVRLPISSMKDDELKGKLLTNLRKIGSEMLWNVMQGIDVNIVGNILNITAYKSGDFDIIDSATSRDRIEQALEEFLPFELQIQLSSTEKLVDQLEQEAERVKKIFGDDIVIIK
ncbi:MAG: DNA polymerase III subunit gamma/tau [Clostridiales bacterium]|nr:DNA polymerase III subunit gamma/tau [Clostridiales bacterium]